MTAEVSPKHVLQPLNSLPCRDRLQKTKATKYRSRAKTLKNGEIEKRRCARSPPQTCAKPLSYINRKKEWKKKVASLKNRRSSMSETEPAYNHFIAIRSLTAPTENQRISPPPDLPPGSTKTHAPAQFWLLGNATQNRRVEGLGGALAELGAGERHPMSTA